MPMLTSTWVNTVASKEFEEPLFVKADEKFWEYDKIFNMGSTDKAVTHFYGYTGFGPAQDRGENEALYFEDAAEGPEIQMLVHKISLGTTVPEEMEDDARNLPGLLNKLGKAIGRSHSYKKALDAALRFNRAFATTYSDYAYTNYAGTAEPIFYDTHTTESGETYDNLFPAASMDYETLQDMQRYFLTGIVDEKGLPVTTKVKGFFYGADLDDDAKVLFKTRKGAPGTANHDITTLGEPDMVPCRLFSPSTMYGMYSEEISEYNLFKQRKPLKTKWWEDNVKNAKMCNALQRYGFKFLDPRFMIASQGA